MRLAVVIVSYNTVDLLRACLTSLREAARELAPALEIEVVVVDNASGDESAMMVADEFPEIMLLAEDENLGFARANNQALAQLGLTGVAESDSVPDLVLLLNPDTLVSAGALRKMAGIFDSLPMAGAAGPKLIYGDGSFQHGAFRFPALGQVLIDLWLPAWIPGGRRLRDSRLNGRYPLRKWEGTAPFAVDFVLGAALMARGSLFRQIGGFDENYFMYCEEMDWCLRVHEAGWQIVAVPGATITHLEGQSSRQVRWVSLERLWRSRLRFYSLHKGRFAPWTLPGVRIALRAAMRRESSRSMRRFASGALTGVAAGDEIRSRQIVADL